MKLKMKSDECSFISVIDLQTTALFYLGHFELKITVSFLHLNECPSPFIH